MLRNPLVRLIAAAAAGVLTALVLLALLQLINGRAGFEGTAAATAFGWAMPLVACGVGVALGWALLRPSRDSRKTTSTAACVCPHCNGEVQSTWRICPHCGAIIDESQTPTGAC